MARQTTGTANWGGNVLQDVYLESFMMMLRKKVGVIYPCAKKGTLPTGSGRKTRWQILGAPAAVTANVAAEGDDPADVNFTTTTAEATLEEFGAVTPYSRLMARTAMSGTMDQIVQALGYQAGLSVEVRTLTVASAATTLVVNSGTAMTADALRQGAQLLVNAGALPNPASPGGNAFVFIGSTEACYDMIGEGAPTWVQAKSRDIESALLTPLDGSPGTSAIWGCIAKLSQSVPRDTTPAPDDDLNVLLGAEAIGCSELDFSAADPQVVVTPPEQSPHVPARNRGTAAWLLFYISKIINQNSMVVIKSDATGT